MERIDYSYGEKVVIACIVGNILLSLFKLLAGIFGNSKAMLADALHSASDIVATSVVLVGIRIAKKPADSEHPYGHGKMESISAGIVGVLLIFAAVSIIKNITESIVDHSFGTPTFLALVAAVISIIVKETMYRISFNAGKRINSEAIIADAWHHRSDAFSSVAAFLGILGGIVGSRLGISYLEYLDPIAGVAVACLIFKVAYDVLARSFHGLMDSSPEDEKIRSIREEVTNTEGVASIPMIKGRYVGQFLFIDMDIEVDPKITVEAGHDIAERVKIKAIETVADVCEVMVHVEPCRKREDF